MVMESKELTKLNKNLNKISKELFRSVDKIPVNITKELAIGANDIRNTIIKSMRDTPKTGRHYKRGKKFHIASSPGNPPAIDFGELVRSIVFDVREMEVEVGSEGGAPYSEFLERGTLKIFDESITPLERMAPRPWLAPAVEKHHQEIIDNVGKEAFDIIGKSFEGIT